MRCRTTIFCAVQGVRKTRVFLTGFGRVGSSILHSRAAGGIVQSMIVVPWRHSLARVRKWLYKPVSRNRYR